MASTVSVRQVYDYVRGQIVSKALFPGNRVAEEEIAKAMSTSRTTVRAAITRLNYEGFVEVVPNCGAFVAKPTITDITHAYTVRTVLEREATRLAVRLITPESLARMRENMQAQRELLPHFSMTEYATLNRAFHWEIIRAANNAYLEKYLNELFNKTAIYLTFYDRSTTNAHSLKTHQALLDALEARDESAAILAIEQDIEWAEEDIRTTGHALD